MNCNEVDQLADFFVLGRVEPDVRRAIELHLAEPGPHRCGEAIARAHEVADALLILPEPSSPDPAVWAEIERGLQAHIAATRAGPAEAPPRARPRPSRTVVVLAAAGWLAAAALLIGLLWRMLSGPAATGLDGAPRPGSDGDRAAVIGTGSPDAAARGALEEAIALMSAPGARVAFLAPPAPGASGAAPGGLAVIAPSGDRGIVVVYGVEHGAGAAPLALWLTRGSAPPAPAGTLRWSSTSSAAGALAASVLAAPAPDGILLGPGSSPSAPSATSATLAGTFRTPRSE
jgi:hypothetical protein